MQFTAYSSKNIVMERFRDEILEREKSRWNAIQSSDEFGDAIFMCGLKEVKRHQFI